jgi:hypothetical protein
MRDLLRAGGRAVVDGAARSLLGVADTVTRRSRVPNPITTVRIIRDLPGGSADDCCQTVHAHLRAAGLLDDRDHDACGPARAPYPVQCLLDVMGPWGLRGAARSAVELYVTYGDPQDVLSSTQVEQLHLAAAHFDDDN